jgi:large subunit ribosomal protein L15
MQIHDLAPAPGSTKKRKRVGRGPGSGHGKTSTRGHKGHKSRGNPNPNFEGGQTPLHRRLPQLRGFKAVNKKQYAIVNVSDLEVFDGDGVVTPELLIERGIVRDLHDGLKILGDGELTKKLTVRAHRFSKSAIEKLQAAGGAAEVL